MADTAGWNVCVSRDQYVGRLAEGIVPPIALTGSKNWKLKSKNHLPLLPSCSRELGKKCDKGMQARERTKQKRTEGRWINMLFAIPIVQFPQNVLRQVKKGGWSRKAMENRFSLPKMQFTYKRGIHSLPGTFTANDDGRSFVICHLPYPAVPSAALECDCPPRSTRFVTNDPSTSQRGHPYRTWPKR